MKKSHKKLVYKLCVTAFVLFCAYITYTQYLSPFLWMEHALLIAHTWSETGASIVLSTAFWPISAIYFFTKYTTTWLAARKTLKKPKPRKR